MSAADVHAEFHLFLAMIGTVFIANLALGLLQSQLKKAVVASIQATAFTTVAMLAIIRPTDPADGQTAMIIPVMWIPFFAAAWLGLLMSNWIKARR